MRPSIIIVSLKYNSELQRQILEAQKHWFFRVKQAAKLKKKHKNAPKFTIWRSKVNKFSGRGALPPSQTSPPVGRGTPPPHTSPPSAPTALRLSRLLCLTSALWASMFHTPLPFYISQSSFSRNMPEYSLNFTLHCSDKSNTLPEIFRHRFYELCDEFKNYC